MRRVIEAVLKTGGYASIVLVGVITLLLLYEVMTRYFLKHPSIWAYDFTRYALLFLTFLGAAWVLKEEGHVKVEIFTSRLSAKNQALITGATSILCLIGCGIFFWIGAKSTWGAYQAREFIDGSIAVPRYLIVWVIPIGAFLLCMQFIRRAWEHLRIFHTAGQKQPTD